MTSQVSISFRSSLPCNVSERKPIDFSNILFDDFDDLSALNIIIMVQRADIVHTHPRVDRCCKSSGWETDLHELRRQKKKDEIKRLSCDISKTLFIQEYVNKRKFAILKDCTHNWKAKKWTFKGQCILANAPLAFLTNAENGKLL